MSNAERNVRERPAKGKRGLSILLAILALIVIVVAAFFILGGDADVDTEGGNVDVEAPDVDADINAPDVDVNDGGDADAEAEKE